MLCGWNGIPLVHIPLQASKARATVLFLSIAGVFTQCFQVLLACVEEPRQLAREIVWQALAMTDGVAIRHQALQSTSME